MQASTYHFGGNFGDVACDGFSSPAVVGHLELDGVSDLEVLDGAVELREVKEEASLAVAALDEPIRVEQLLYDPSLPDARATARGGRGVGLGMIDASLGRVGLVPAAIVASGPGSVAVLGGGDEKRPDLKAGPSVRTSAHGRAHSSVHSVSGHATAAAVVVVIAHAASTIAAVVVVSVGIHPSSSHSVVAPSGVAATGVPSADLHIVERAAAALLPFGRVEHRGRVATPIPVTSKCNLNTF